MLIYFSYTLKYSVNKLCAVCFGSDVTPTTRHEDFRLFACMNPATDVGKKDLPPGIRNRFVDCLFSLVCEYERLQKMAIQGTFHGPLTKSLFSICCTCIETSLQIDTINHMVLHSGLLLASYNTFNISVRTLQRNRPTQLLWFYVSDVALFRPLHHPFSTIFFMFS